MAHFNFPKAPAIARRSQLLSQQSVLSAFIGTSEFRSLPPHFRDARTDRLREINSDIRFLNHLINT